MKVKTEQKILKMKPMKLEIQKGQFEKFNLEFLEEYFKGTETWKKILAGEIIGVPAVEFLKREQRLKVTETETIMSEQLLKHFEAIIEKGFTQEEAEKIIKGEDLPNFENVENRFYIRKLYKRYQNYISIKVH